MRATRAIGVPAATLLLAGCGAGGAPAEKAAEVRRVATESRAAEAPPVLEQAFLLQEAYRGERGRWAATFAELAEVGWEDPPGMAAHRQPRIVRAEGEELCIVIEPLDERLQPQHVDQTGEVRPGPCP
jgi:hypothetical protein